MKYIKDYILKNDGFVKVLSDPIIENTDKGLVICQLDFNYSSKETQELLQLLYGIITEFKSQYGSNQDKFYYDLDKNILTKEYTVIAGKNKISKNYIKTFPLTEELKKELIDYIIIKGKEYSNMNLDENTEPPVITTNIVEEKLKSNFKSIKELKDFSTFKDIMEIDIYLRTTFEGMEFIKWLQEHKLTSLNSSFAPTELSHKSIEELNELRKEYLNN